MQKMELRYWWEHGNKKKNISGMEFFDTMGVKRADLKDKIQFLLFLKK